MKRLALALCLALLVPSVAFAANPSLQCSAMKSSKAAPLDFAPAGQLPLSAGEHLFFDAEELAGQADVEVRFFLDSVIYLTETLPLKSLKPAAKPTEGVPPRTVVELLAVHPKERKRLAKISQQEPERISVEIWRGATLLRSASFAQLQQEGGNLLKAPFRPEVIHSQVSGKGNGERPWKSVTEATCADGCEAARNECYATTCPGMDYCEECEQQYQECMAGCQPPPPPPSCQYNVQYYWTGYYYVGTNVYWWDQICYPDVIWYYYDGLWHVRVEDVFRRDYIERTTYTNCTTSQQVVGYQYLFISCYDWTGSACYDPWYPFNTCY